MSVCATILAWIVPLFTWLGFFVGLFNLLILFIGLFLILLVLIQRGKGGGLAGAFGGAGGSSAFGSRAGDTFTRITIVVAAIWLLLIMLQIKLTQPVPLTPEQRALQAQQDKLKAAEDANKKETP
jgi:protein translocase SecG subunit